MYKSALYQLCQKRAWPFPSYDVSRCGPDHNSRFRASVRVNGVQFNADELSRSSKEAQNKVSQVALEHLAPTAPESLPPSTGAVRSNLSFKHQLHKYAAKNRFDPPIYTRASEGPKHALQFKAEVTVGGRTYHSTKSFSSSKEAEHDAAKAALMLLTGDETDNAKDGSVSDKTLLIDSARKEDISMPSNKTTSNGVVGFSSIADVVKSGKQAKNNTAKDTHMPSSPKHVSSVSYPAVSQNLEHSLTTENDSGACLDDNPSYDVSRYVPDHNSRFRATVLVNGVQFNADDLSRSSKAAQNKVNQVALEHLAPAAPESLPPSTGAVRSNLSFKHQLHEYASKNRFDPPIYTCASEEPKNALQFKAEVTVGGRTYHSTKSFSSSKEAEHDAAKAALMLLTSDETDNSKDGSISDKTLLIDSARKEDISMPSNKTTSNGVDGFTSIADVVKSGRQAKNNTAKDTHMPSSPKHVSSVSHPAVSQKLEESLTTENDSGACLDDKGKNVSKDNARRVWSLEDEITLLNSILEFRLKCGKEVDSSSMESFCHFLEGKLSFTKKPKCDRVSQKIKALKRKYSEKELDCFTAKHDFKMKEITSQVWPLDVKSHPKRRKYPMLKEEVQKLNVFDPSKKLKFEEEAQALEENLRS